MNEIENRLNEWIEKQRYLEEVGEAALKDDQKKPFPISILPVSNIVDTLAEERSQEE